MAEQGFPRGTAVELATLRAGSGLRMRDCSVLLAAREAGARLASFDAPLTRVAANLGLAILKS